MPATRDVLVKIRVIARLREGRNGDVSISGDFTLLPSFALGALEQSIRGIKATPETLHAPCRKPISA
jgi:hypothetical protein